MTFARLQKRGGAVPSSDEVIIHPTHDIFRGLGVCREFAGVSANKGQFGAQ